MVKSHKQLGFSPVILILILIALSVIAFVGWRVYDATQQTNKSLSEAQKASNATIPEMKGKEEKPIKDKKIVVPGIGYEFVAPDSLKDLVFYRVDYDDRTAVYITTKKLESLEPDCNAKDGMPLGAMVKMKGQYQDLPPLKKPGFLLKQNKNDFISFTGPQAACSADEAVQRLAVDSLEAFMRAANIHYPE